jgi:hypothetical protein
LLDKAWLAFVGTAWEVGTLGAGATSTLPVDQIALWADSGLVLSIDSATGSTVFVREMSTGKGVLEGASDLEVHDGVIRGDQFYLTGVIGGSDAGIWRGAIGDVGLTQLVPGSDGPIFGDRGSFRTGIKVSPTGKTLASTVCVEPACVTQIVSSAGGPVLTIADSIARWVSEEYVVINERPTIRAYSVEDGKLLWKLDDLDFWDGYFTSDGRMFIAQAQTLVGGDLLNELWLVDARSGSHQAIATIAPGQYLFASLSSDRYAVVLASSDLSDAVASGIAFDVLDLMSGELVTSEPFPQGSR